MQAIADQLQGGDMALDYDQILAKRPASEDAIFAWYVPFISSSPFQTAAGQWAQVFGSS